MRERERERDRQTDRQTDRQRNGKAVNEINSVTISWLMRMIDFDSGKR